MFASITWYILHDIQLYFKFGLYLEIALLSIDHTLYFIPIQQTHNNFLPLNGLSSTFAKSSCPIPCFSI